MSRWAGNRHRAGAAARTQTGSDRGLRLRELSKRYGQVQALDGVSLELQSGRFLVLLGPSGSGKSTLIRCLAGIERPSRGEIELAGRLVAGDREHLAPERRDLAMVFQDFALWPHMSVSDNVRFALRRRNLRAAESRRRADAMLARVGLAEKRDRFPHELSGGEQQRVALARALVAEPKLLLFDEPLSSLDAGLRERLRIEIGSLARESGATSVYITHDQSEAFALGDEVGLLKEGRLMQMGSPEQIYANPDHAFVARFTGVAGAFRGRLLGFSGEHARVALPIAEAQGGHVQLAARCSAQLQPGAAVQVLVRPGGVRLLDLLSAEASLLAMVREVAYCGRGYEHALAVGGAHELIGVFDERRFERDCRCGVALDPEACFAFPDEPASGMPSALTADALPDLKQPAASAMAPEQAPEVAAGASESGGSTVAAAVAAGRVGAEVLR